MSLVFLSGGKSLNAYKLGGIFFHRGKNTISTLTVYARYIFGEPFTGLGV